jgi:hypothetical protein
MHSGCFQSNVFDSLANAQILLAKYPVRSSVMVRINPHRAADSQLLRLE